MLRTDDELNTVNSEFLGPDGYTFFFRARYVAYGIGIALAVFAFVCVHRFRVPINLFTVIWVSALVVLGTRWLAGKVSHEIPVRAALVMFWHEVNGPRPGRATTSTFRPIRRPEAMVVHEDESDPMPETMGGPGVSDLCALWIHEGCPEPCACACH